MAKEIRAGGNKGINYYLTFYLILSLITFQFWLALSVKSMMVGCSADSLEWEGWGSEVSREVKNGRREEI